ncbi:MAG: sigma-54-dependent Fis family transcriptional regulator, partial [Ignavibacteria bacterium]
GKEVVANIIHYSSNRAEKPLIKVSCAILSEDVIESELFGHEKGAFTGAEKTRIGRFEEANYGTIFLDDIDDVPLSVQVKLLRALQENEIERVGSNKPIKIDVRVVASTKVNLEKLVEEGKFREDLYYRLNVFPINLPPLRNRKEDIRILIKKFVEHFAEGRSITVEEDFFEILTQYHWPGNVRQLKNFIERCMILAADGVIHKGMIPREYCTSENMLSIDDLDGKSLPDIISEFEMNIIKSFLDKNGWNKTKTAEELGIPLNTLRSKMEKFGLNN